MTNSDLPTISWDELVIGDILKYNLATPSKKKNGASTVAEEVEEHYEIILSISRDFAKTLNTKRTDQNKFSRHFFSAAVTGRAVLMEKDNFFVLRDDETFRPLADPEDLAEWDRQVEEEAQQKKRNAEELLSNLEKLAKIQERVNPLMADDMVPFEQLQEEWSIFGRTGKAGKAVFFKWHTIYAQRFAKEKVARNPTPPPDPAFDRG